VGGGVSDDLGKIMAGGGGAQEGITIEGGYETSREETLRKARTGMSRVSKRRI